MNYIYEHIIAKNYHWSLEQIRNLDYYDFQVHIRLCLESENTENEFKLALAGGSPKKKTFDEILQTGRPGSKEKLEQEFDPSTNEFKSKKGQVTKVYQKFDPKTGYLIGE